MTYIAERYLAGEKSDGSPKDRSHPRKPPTEAHRQVAKDVLRRGKSVSESLIKAGYAPKQAAKGMWVVERCNGLRVAFQEEAARIEKDKQKAPLFPSENALEGLIMNRLERNIIKGEDRAVQSCKLAGSHRKLNLWTVDNLTGVIVVNAVGVTALPLTVPEDAE